MRNYELVLIFKPTLSDEERANLFERITAPIKENGEITNTDDWGMRKLAYEINYIKEGYYYIVDFKSEKDVVAEIERRCKINDGIIRYMAIRKDS